MNQDEAVYEPRVGVDTVAIGGIATVPLFPITQLRRSSSGSYSGKITRDQISLFVSVRNGHWTFRLQASLPRLISGGNFETIRLCELSRAIEFFLAEAQRAFPELAHVPLDALPIRRVDIAFDLPVEATQTLIQALRDCYFSNRGQPGFVYQGGLKSSFYAKDFRGKRPASYRSLIAYPKAEMVSGKPGLRLETRFHSAYIRNKHPQNLLLSDLSRVGEDYIRAGWKYVLELFEHLRPHDDDSLEAAVQGAPESQRSFLLDFGYLAREVPLDQLKVLFFGKGKMDPRPFRRYGVGFGNSDFPELRKFARVREEWSLHFASTYKNIVENLPERRLSPLHQSLYEQFDWVER